jgi:hypothetical protein
MNPGITSWIRLAVLSGIAAIVAAFLGWQAGEVTPPAVQSAAPTGWTLPPQPTEDPQKDLTMLTARRPWTNPLAAARLAAGGTQPGAAQNSNATPAWRLAGLVQRPDVDFALILIGPPGAEKLEYRGIGEALPDGSILVQITSEPAVTETAGSSGKQQVYWLFRGKS